MYLTPEIKEKIFAEYGKSAKDTGSTEAQISTIIVSDSSCMMNLEGYIRKNNLPLAVVHLIDVISSF